MAFSLVGFSHGTCFPPLISYKLLIIFFTMSLPIADLKEHPAWIYNPSTDLQEYPDWIHGPELQTPRFDGDPRCRRSIFIRLEQALKHGGYRPHQ